MDNYKFNKANNDVNMSLYHYTTFDSFIKIWVSQKLRFSVARNTNDIFEQNKNYELKCRLISKYPNKSKLDVAKEFDSLLQYELDLYKQISFTEDYKDDGYILSGYASPMMWGQYADNANGVCIEFNKQDLLNVIYETDFKKAITYDEEVKEIQFEGDVELSQDGISQYVRTYIDNLFYHKHVHWKPENEFRIVRRTENLNEFLPLDSVRKKVYVTKLYGAEIDIIRKLVDRERLYYLSSGGKIRELKSELLYVYLDKIEGRWQPKPLQKGFKNLKML